MAWRHARGSGKRGCLARALAWGEPYPAVVFANHPAVVYSGNVEPQDQDAGAWTYVLDEASLAEGEMRAVCPLGVNIVLARVGGELYALAGKCAHMACPLSMGTLDGYTLVCPCHDWRYDVRTGRFRAAPELGLQVYPLRIEQGRVFVSLR